MATNYFSIWKEMPKDNWATAKEIGVAPATLAAMVRRNMVEATNSSPKQYRRVITNATILEMLLSYIPSVTIGLYSEGADVGMLCPVKNGKVYDCWGDIFDFTTAVKVRIGTRYFDLRTGKEIEQ